MQANHKLKSKKLQESSKMLLKLMPAYQTNKKERNMILEE